MMTEEVHNLDGKPVHVLDVTDLERAKDSLIRWLVGTGLVSAFVLGAFVTNLQAKNAAQDVILSDYQAHAAWAREASRTLDSLRIETRHLSEVVTELATLIQQRGLR